MLENCALTRFSNGEKSKLNRMQWAQVRTANFKAWFGDWEAADYRVGLMI